MEEKVNRVRHTSFDLCVVSAASSYRFALNKKNIKKSMWYENTRKVINRWMPSTNLYARCLLFVFFYVYVSPLPPFSWYFIAIIFFLFRLFLSIEYFFNELFLYLSSCSVIDLLVSFVVNFRASESVENRNFEVVRLLKLSNQALRSINHFYDQKFFKTLGQQRLILHKQQSCWPNKFFYPQHSVNPKFCLPT